MIKTIDKSCKTNETAINFWIINVSFRMEETSIHDISWTYGIHFVKIAIYFFLSLHFLIKELAKLSFVLDDISDPLKKRGPRLTVKGTLFADEVNDFIILFDGPLLLVNYVSAYPGVPGLELVDIVLKVVIELVNCNIMFDPEYASFVIDDLLCCLHQIEELGV